MYHVLTAAQMRVCDAYTINELAVSAAILMEDAANAATERILAIFRERGFMSDSRRPRVVVLCGSGNNGGDGFVIARKLAHIAELRVFWTGSTDKMSAETLMNNRSLEKYAALVGFPMTHLQTEQDVAAMNLAADCIIDALFGVGGSEHPRGLVLPILERLSHVNRVNSARDVSPQAAFVTIAIDVPTGLHSDTGKAHPLCFGADYTITMAALKAGLLLQDAPDVCGSVNVVDIGIPKSVIAAHSNVSVLEDEDICRLLPPRKRRMSKHNYGSVGIIGGSVGMAGAAALCANASIRAGAGLVRLYSTAMHPAIRPEIMTQLLPTTNNGTIAETAFEALCKAVEVNSVIVIGPGLGVNMETIALCKRLLDYVLEHFSEKIIVLDADGLRCVLPESKLNNNVILTPHHGEFARLTGLQYNDINEYAHRYAVEWAQTLGCVVLLKNVPTIVSHNGHSYWNTNGNAGMATAGSGDVLAGIIAALAAQHVTPFEAAALGAFLHGKAGDWYAKHYNQETLTAGGLTEALSHVLPTAFAPVFSSPEIFRTNV